MPYFYSTRALAKHIGTSPQTILNWIDAGLLRPDPVPYVGKGATYFHVWNPQEVNKAKKLKGKLKAGRPRKAKSKKRGRKHAKQNRRLR
jgi:hypothetical protein